MKERTNPTNVQNGKHYTGDITTAESATPRYILMMHTYPRMASTSRVANQPVDHTIAKK
jgi:hypothetical protein